MATGVSVFAQRKRQRRENFLAGRARSAHRLPLSLEQSIVEDSPTPSSSSSSQQLSPSCKRGCPQILRGLRPAFDAAGLHPAKTLQKRLASYPVPKKQKVAHRNIRGTLHAIHNNTCSNKFQKFHYNEWYNKKYALKISLSLSPSLSFSLSKSLKAQNQWLRENTVDAHGNLLYCRDCLVACLGVHTSRIQRQRQIKQRQKEQPIVEMTKEEVEDRKLVDCVLREDEEVLTFAAWWKTVDKDEVVEVQYPHERHGLAGRRSNHAKQDVSHLQQCQAYKYKLAARLSVWPWHDSWYPWVRY